jgi:hypothetical protein
MLCCTIDKARRNFFTTVKRQPIDSGRTLLQHWAIAMKKPNEHPRAPQKATNAGTFCEFPNVGRTI